MAKAWYLDIKDDPDQGAFIVFADTRNEARGQAGQNDLIYDRWIDVQARRAKQYDGMENLSDVELALHQWHDGWRWFDFNYPDPDEATDEEFIKWYEDNFENAH